eukprot:scaffold126661_cov28-Tisochrysis_lutea.AAC.18
MNASRLSTAMPSRCDGSASTRRSCSGLSRRPARMMRGDAGLYRHSSNRSAVSSHSAASSPSRYAATAPGACSALTLFLGPSRGFALRALACEKLALWSESKHPVEQWHEDALALGFPLDQLHAHVESEGICCEYVLTEFRQLDRHLPAALELEEGLADHRSTHFHHSPQLTRIFHSSAGGDLGQCAEAEASRERGQLGWIVGSLALRAHSRHLAGRLWLGGLEGGHPDRRRERERG